MTKKKIVTIGIVAVVLAVTIPACTYSVSNLQKSGTAIVNGLMTAILLDISSYRVEEEITLDRGDGEVASSFFAQPRTREKEDVDIVAAFADTEF